MTPKKLVAYLKKQKVDKVSDETELKEIVALVIKTNPKAVADYRKGRVQVIGFLVGQVMKETQGKADAGIVKKLLLEKLK